MNFVVYRNYGVDMSTKAIPVMFKKFYETGNLRVQSGRVRVPVTQVFVDVVKIAVPTQSHISEIGRSSACYDFEIFTRGDIPISLGKFKLINAAF